MSKVARIAGIQEWVNPVVARHIITGYLAGFMGRTLEEQFRDEDYLQGIPFEQKINEWRDAGWGRGIPAAMAKEATRAFISSKYTGSGSTPVVRFYDLLERERERSASLRKRSEAGETRDFPGPLGRKLEDTVEGKGNEALMVLGEFEDAMTRMMEGYIAIRDSDLYETDEQKYGKMLEVEDNITQLAVIAVYTYDDIVRGTEDPEDRPDTYLNRFLRSIPKN